MEIESNKSSNNKRIAKNTLLLYFRLIITMLVSLYTSRVVLNVLGVVDYGIYNVVGGVVGMLAFFNGTMSAATQRFLSFEIGRGDSKALIKVYSITIQIHFLISVLVVLLAETIGLWFLYSRMNFPPERMNAIFWVYQFSVFSFALSVIQVPYNAAIIAFERMNVFAYISIFEVSLKLLSVFLLMWISFDKLILYAGFTFCISLLVRFIYVIYVRKKLKMCQYEFCKDIKMSKLILSYAGYNFIAHFALMLRTQGISILLNIFFGPIINAANAIAIQIKNAIDSFSQNFIVAVNPQIVKSYARNDMLYMNNLIIQSSKFSFILLNILCLPILMETEYILNLWLKNPPIYSILFTKLIIVNIMADALSGTIGYGALATGRIKKYQLIIASFYILTFPIIYILFKKGFQAEICFYVSIFVSTIVLCARLYLLKGLIGFPIMSYLNNVVKIGVVIFVFSLILPYIIIQNIDMSFLRLILTTVTSVFSCVCFSFFIGLKKQEQKQLLLKVKEISSRLIHQK